MKKKSYFINLLFAAVALLFAANAGAQTFYVGTKGYPTSVSGTSGGYEGRMLSFDFSDISTASGEYCKIPTGSSSEDYSVRAGATMGDAYYALTRDDAYQKYYLYSMNMEADEATLISECASGFDASDMAYSSATDQMFVLQSSTSSSTLYTLDVTDGSLTEYCTFDGTVLRAIAEAEDGTMYGLLCEQTGGSLGAYTYSLALYTIDLDAKTCEQAYYFGDDMLGGTTRLSTTMAYYDGKLYFVSGRLIFIIDPATGDVSTVDGSLAMTSVAGLTFTKSTSDSATSADEASTDAQTFYVGTKGYPTSVSGTSGGYEGRILSFDFSDISTASGEYCKIPTGSSSEDYSVRAGATMGDAYYALTRDDAYSKYYLYSMNMEADEATLISECASGFDASDMAYSSATDQMFVLQSGTSSSTLYTLDVTDGSLTEYCTFDGTVLRAIAEAEDGTMYGLWCETTGGSLGAYIYGMALYTIDLDAKTCEQAYYFGDDMLGGTTRLSTTMAYHEGKLYFLSGRQMSVIDPATGDVSTVDGSLAMTSVAGLTFTKSTSDGATSSGDGEGGTTGGATEEEDTGLRVTSVVECGNTMGTVGIDVPTRRTDYYYDENNNLVRAIKTSLTTDLTSWEPTRYYKYEYDEAGQLTKYLELSWTMESTGEDFWWKSVQDTVSYEYDAAGNLVRENYYRGTDTTYYMAYAYDEAGQLVYEAKMMYDSSNKYDSTYYLNQSKTYSDFAGFNKPRRTVADGVYSSYQYVITTEYDDDLHEVESIKWSADETQMKEVERFIWRNDSLVIDSLYKVSYTDGEAVLTSTKVTTYDCVDGDPNVVLSYTTGSAASSTGYIYTYYTTLDYMYAPFDLEATEVEDDINTYQLTWEAPSLIGFGTLYFDIYRAGILIASVGTDALDTSLWKFAYTDKNVPNGDYDYMVQTVWVNELEDTTYYNVANIVDVSPYVELPPATNLRYVSHETSGDEELVTVAWDEPEDLDPALLFERYDLFFTRYKVAETAEEDGQATEYTVSFLTDVESLYVQTVYHFGKVDSDTLTIDLNDLPVADVIDAAKTTGDGLVTISQSEISIDGVASSVVLYNMGGAMAASYRNVSSADISLLSHGVYVAVITVDGKNMVVKFSK